MAKLNGRQLAVWNEIHREAGSWNGTTLTELETKAVRWPILRANRAEIRAVMYTMRDRLDVNRVDVVRLATNCPGWERFAAAYVDAMIHDGQPQINDSDAGDDIAFSLCWAEWLAFLEGVADHDRTTTSAHDAFNAGRLARILLDERQTFVTRIWEYLARGCRYQTADVIARGLGLELTQTRHYLSWLEREGYLERRTRDGRPVRYEYRRKYAGRK
jgi:hypothetical protein